MQACGNDHDEQLHQPNFYHADSQSLVVASRRQRHIFTLKEPRVSHPAPRPRTVILYKAMLVDKAVRGKKEEKERKDVKSIRLLRQQMSDSNATDRPTDRKGTVYKDFLFSTSSDPTAYH